MHLFAQPPLGPDAEAIPDQQHPDQQLEIDRRTACVAVETSKMGADAAQIDKPINGPKQVISGNMILQRKLVEKCCLRFVSRSQHCSILPLVRELNQRLTLRSSTSFSTKYALSVDHPTHAAPCLTVRNEAGSGYPLCVARLTASSQPSLTKRV